MSMPSIPTSYSSFIRSEGEMDVDTTLALSGGIDTNLKGDLNTNLSGEIATDNVLTLKGDPAAPIATDSKMEIMNLPRFTLKDIKDMMKVRVRMPNYSNVCLKVLGVELMSVSMGGESQIITEPYIPNAAENCEVDCCEPDIRPFPLKKDIGVVSK